MILHRGDFNAGDLKRVKYKNPVVLNSGGPVMEVIGEESDTLLCEWENEGKISRAQFGRKTISRLVPFDYEV